MLVLLVLVAMLVLPRLLRRTQYRHVISRRGRRDGGGSRHVRCGRDSRWYYLRLGNGDIKSQSSLHAIFLHGPMCDCKVDVFDKKIKGNSGRRKKDEVVNEKTATVTRFLIEPL